MNTNRMMSTFAENQNSGNRINCTGGTKKIPARPRNSTPNTGSVIRSKGRAGFAAWKKQSNALAPKIATGIRPEPYFSGKIGCQPPRNRSVAMQETVTMLAYSAMKNDANFMLAYSTWKPATSSFSASGRSNGTRLVSANPASKNKMKLKICGNGI